LSENKIGNHNFLRQDKLRNFRDFTVVLRPYYSENTKIEIINNV